MKNKIIKEIKKGFTDGQVKNFMNEYNISELESCLYLYFFNNVSVHTDDQRKDCGRKMYLSFAKAVGKLFEND